MNHHRMTVFVKYYLIIQISVFVAYGELVIGISAILIILWVG